MEKQKKEFQELGQYDFIEEEYIHKVEDKYAPCIGLLLIRFSSLEHTLNLEIAQVINERGHEIGYKIIEKLSFWNKIELFYKFYIRIVAIKKIKKEKESLNSISGRLKKINSFRNIVAHANWYSLTENRKVRSKIEVDGEDGFIKFQYEIITPKIINKKIREIEKLDEDIQEFVFQVYNN